MWAPAQWPWAISSTKIHRPGTFCSGAFFPKSLPWRGGGAAQPWRKGVSLYPTLISGILAEGVCHPGSQKSADPAARHFKRLPILAPSRKWIVHRAARDFGADEVLETEGILCVFQGFQNAQMRQKIRRTGGKTFWRRCIIKKGAGRTLHSPRCSSRFACKRLFSFGDPSVKHIRRTEPCGP